MHLVEIALWVVFTMLLFLMTVYLAIFAFFNEDPPSCFVVKGMDSASLTSRGAIVKAE